MEYLVAFAALAAMEIVLGIDNIVFISILVDRLPEAQRKKARLIGLGLAMGMRLLLLFTLTWIMGLVAPLFQIPIHPALWETVPTARESARRRRSPRGRG